MLKIKDLEVRYGGIVALKKISLDIKEGELVTLIGSNGAGKTTTLKAIARILEPSAGTISYLGDAAKTTPHELVAKGLALVPEGRGIFTRMTVQENLLMGAYLRKDDEIDEDLSQMFAYFPRLKERLSQLAGTLSGGEQQMVAIARALMARPRLLLLDEPSMGLSPIMVDTIFDVISQISKAGMTILLVEQNANKALQLANRGYVLESGEITISGTGEDLLQDPRISEAYLGE